MIYIQIVPWQPLQVTLEAVPSSKHLQMVLDIIPQPQVKLNETKLEVANTTLTEDRTS
jgi:hypothetical protein